LLITLVDAMWIISAWIYLTRPCIF